MILWNGADEHQEFLDIHRRDHAIENPVRVKIVSHLNSRAAQAKRRAEAAGGFEPVGAAVQRVVDQVRSGAKSREDA